MLHSVLRIGVLVVAPALFSVNLDHGARERPRLSSVEPQVAAPAEIVTAYGVNLHRSRVVELLLSNGERRSITRIVEQRPDLIRFRVPSSLEPGAYRIVLVVDSRWATELIEQDIELTVAGVSSRSGSASAAPFEPRSGPPRYR